MIQRVQTLFLLGVAILMTLVLVFPIWSNQSESMQAVVGAYNIKIFQNDQFIKEEGVWYIAAISLLSAITALFCIFQFKNRKLQLRLNMLNNLFIAGTIGTMLLAINTAGDLLQNPDDPSFKLAFFFPPVALILNMFANHYIRKDEKLVRSMDRLR